MKKNGTLSCHKSLSPKYGLDQLKEFAPILSNQPKETLTRVACGKWNPWQNSQSGDNSNTHPDPLSPPTVLEKGTGLWASLPTPPSAVELTCPWAPARHLLLLLQIPSSLLKYSSSFPSLCYMSFEILVRTFLLLKLQILVLKVLICFLRLVK